MIQRLLLLGLFATLGACSSTDEKGDGAGEASVPCTCGQPEAAFDGCAHPKCVAGERNPENPECVCGPLDYEE